MILFETEALGHRNNLDFEVLLTLIHSVLSTDVFGLILVEYVHVHWSSSRSQVGISARSYQITTNAQILRKYISCEIDSCPFHDKEEHNYQSPSELQTHDHWSRILVNELGKERKRKEERMSRPSRSRPLSPLRRWSLHRCTKYCYSLLFFWPQRDTVFNKRSADPLARALEALPPWGWLPFSLAPFFAHNISSFCAVAAA